jgi:hypothetical protein
LLFGRIVVEVSVVRGLWWTRDGCCDGRFVV